MQYYIAQAHKFSQWDYLFFYDILLTLCSGSTTVSGRFLRIASLSTYVWQTSGRHFCFMLAFFLALMRGDFYLWDRYCNFTSPSSNLFVKYETPIKMSYGRPPPRIDGMVSLKVDNLTYRTTPEDLRRVFERCGEVGDIYIPRDRYTRESRGFAFVR